MLVKMANNVFILTKDKLIALKWDMLMENWSVLNVIAFTTLTQNENTAKLYLLYLEMKFKIVFIILDMQQMTIIQKIFYLARNVNQVIRTMKLQVTGLLNADNALIE